MNQKRSIYIGFDPREGAAFFTAISSIKRHLSPGITVHALELTALQAMGYYTRGTERHSGRLWDKISEHPMSTEFAISRFFVPYLADQGWALFADSDIIARRDFKELFDLADPKYAVMCVKHQHYPREGLKMDGQTQSTYGRKNWSSVCLFNCDHPANKKGLTLELLNSVPGRDLHAFCWLKDEDIGDLPPEWNYLVGYTGLEREPAIVHYTTGGPWMSGFTTVEYAEDWRKELRLSAGLKL